MPTKLTLDQHHTATTRKVFLNVYVAKKLQHQAKKESRVSLPLSLSSQIKRHVVVYSYVVGHSRMAWPKKGTHKIVVDGTPFLWHYSGHCPLCSNAVITVGGRFVLYVDPFRWNFEFRPASIADAIRWAVGEGWSSNGGPTRSMAFDDKLGHNVWLPDGARHLADLNAAAE